MRGRIAAFAIGSHMATKRTEAAMSQQAQAQPQQAPPQQAPPQAQPPQEDITQKLQKLADLHKQGILSDEEFQKMKADLIANL
ncbi:MAG: SHOCT domain-containing protein [Nitrososphaeraceae archaeon]